MFGQLQNQLHYKPLQEDPTITHLTRVELRAGVTNGSEKVKFQTK